MKIAKDLALAVFNGLGFKTGSWNLDTMNKKMPKIVDLADKDTDLGDDEQNAVLKKLLKALAAEEEITIVDAEAEDEPAPKKTAKKAAAKAEEEEEAPAPKKTAKKKPAAEEEPEPEAEAEAEGEAEEEPAPKKKAATTTEEGGKGKKVAKAAPAPKPAGPEGVRYTRSRPYIAGIIVKKHGLNTGITEAMVKELDEAYGDKNPTESKFCLRNAWHAVRGYATKDNEKDLEHTADE